MQFNSYLVNPLTKTIRLSILTCTIIASTLLPGCNPWSKPRPIYMRCKSPVTEFNKIASDIFVRNGYSIKDFDTTSGLLSANIVITDVAYRYSALERQWFIAHKGDTVEIHVRSISTRLDGSDVVQTWDKRWSGEEVKMWMRPILTSLEVTCGISSPVSP